MGIFGDIGDFISGAAGKVESAAEDVGGAIEGGLTNPFGIVGDQFGGPSFGDIGQFALDSTLNPFGVVGEAAGAPSIPDLASGGAEAVVQAPLKALGVSDFLKWGLLATVVLFILYFALQGA